MSEDCKDFIWRLLDKNPSTRLGSNGDIAELLAHPWLKQINTDDILAKRVKAPLIPKLSDCQLDTNNFRAEITQQEMVDTIIPRERLRMI